MPVSTKHLKPPAAAPKGLRFEDLLERSRAHGRSFDEDWLRRVHDYAAERHREQVRYSGEPYLSHLLAVAWILADLKFDQTCVGVGLLHDVLEDTGTERAQLTEDFGEEIATLVDGVSKIGKHAYVRRDDAQAESFRKLILASARDIRVIVVKLADRLHNMMTLEHMEADKVRRIARETLEIYSPIAHRLGMSLVKRQLEDLAFYHLYPHQFAQLQAQLEERVKVGRDATRRILEQLRATLDRGGMQVTISHRVKGYYSIYQKLRRQDIDINELYDYLAFRIVVHEVRDCYAALGVVHQAWRPIPGRFKDYIAVPKPNLYQSLHTTLLGEQGQPFEVQIRTELMDTIAEEGIAAHWRYKEGRPGAPAADENIPWLRQLLEWQKEVSDPRTFLSTLKIDLYPDEAYVFTPRGDVRAFPRGATALDFAYRIHTDVGHHCSGARINGRLVPLRTVLQNGDIVEILTNTNRQPSRDWLAFVVTPRAKSKIRHWLNHEQKLRAVELGRTLMEKEVRKSRVNWKRLLDSAAMAKLLADEGLPSLDELWSRIGFGRTPVRQVIERVLSEQELKRADEQPGMLRQAVSKLLPAGSAGVVVKGHGDLLAFLAKCCRPVPGDEIVGYITRGRGVGVHSAECPNVRNLLYHPEREIDVEWARRTDGVFEIGITIRGEDSPGLLAKITEAIAKLQTNIRHVDARGDELGRAAVVALVEVRNRDQVERLLDALRRLPGVSRVERSSPGTGIPVPSRD